MTKRLLSKYKVCKKLKNPYKNLWGLKKKDVCRSVVSKKRKRLTPFGKLLDTKQSLKLFYSNLGENIFKCNVKSSLKSPSKTLDKLASIIESRLDSVIFRSCFVVSFQEARQLINHGFITVNDICVTSVNKRINKGDIVKVKSLNISKEMFFSVISSRSLPNYLEIDLKSSSIIFLWDTNFKNTYYPIRMKYSNITRYYK
jgi:small subunit ribosomal protein S4